MLFGGWYEVWMWTSIHEVILREKNVQLDEKNQEIERQRQEIELWRDLAWGLRGSVDKAAAATGEAVSLASKAMNRARQ